MRTATPEEAATLLARTGVDPDGDWAVCDLVHYHPATSRGLEDDRFTVEAHRYGPSDDLPDPDAYASGEREYEVHRVRRDSG